MTQVLEREKTLQLRRLFLGRSEWGVFATRLLTKMRRRKAGIVFGDLQSKVLLPNGQEHKFKFTYRLQLYHFVFV